MPGKLLNPNVIVAARRVRAASAPKPWYTSKTLWLNAGVLALAGAESQLNLLQPLLPVNVYGLVAFALPIANGVLRLITSSAVTLRPPAAAPGSEPTP